jgi:hypothetical protein
VTPPRLPDADAGGAWRARGIACLDAAAQIEERNRALAWPRCQLLALALECAFKTFLREARGGVPDSRDLSRLSSLAAHCGLALTDEDRACLAGVERGCRSGELPGAADDLPTVARVTLLCRTIDPGTAATDPHPPP